MSFDEAGEVWRRCPTYDAVEASSCGRVRVGGKMNHPTPDKDGYLRTWASSEGKRRNTSHHAAVADAFIGPRPAGYEIDHIDGVRTNNRPENLRYLTHADNVRASAAAGRSMRGENHVCARLTEKQALEILATFRRSPPQGRYVRNPVGIRSLAEKYKVGIRAIGALVTGETWKHLPRSNRPNLAREP